MKPFKVLLAVLSVTVAPCLFAQEVPTFSTPENFINTLGYNTTHAKVKYDNNLGRTNVSFSLPLPVGNRPIRSSLTMTYSSHLFFNLGLGNGFEIQLPQLQKVTNHERKAAYLYDDGTSVVEIGVSPDKKLYELELSKFNQYKYENEGKENVISVISSDGVKRTFMDGQLIVESYPGMGNFVNYSWKGYLLEKISTPNKVLAEFVYDDCKTNKAPGDFQVYYRGNWKDQTKCLSSIKLAEKTVNFDYDSSRSLTKVAWSSGGKIFEAKYGKNADVTEVHNNDGIAFGTIAEKSLLIKYGKGRVYFEDEDTFYKANGFVKNPGSIGFYASGNFAEIFPADFDNDGNTDYLVYSAERIAGTDGGQSTDGTNVFGPAPKSGDWKTPVMELRLGHEKNGKLEFSASSKYQLSSEFMVAETDQTNHGSEAGYDNKFLFKTIPIFGDFDGNKKIDILLCGIKNRIAYNTYDGFREEASNIKCPRESLAYDVNMDGISDLITKDEVYLGSPEGLKQVFQIPGNIVSIQTKLKRNEIKYGLFDKDYDGAPDILEKNQAVYVSDVNEDKEFQYWSQANGIGKYETKKLFPVNPLLVSVKTQEGGITSLQYDIKASIPVLVRAVYDNLQQSPRAESYQYLGSFFHPYTSELLGFSIVKSIDHQTKNFAGKLTISEYFRDNQASNTLERAQKHGLLSRQFECDITRCKNLAQDLLNKKEILQDYIRAKENFFKIEKPFEDNRYFIHLSKNVNKFYEAPGVINADFNMAQSYSESNLFTEFKSWGPAYQTVIRNEGLDGDHYARKEAVEKKFVLYDGRAVVKEEKKLWTNGAETVVLNHRKYNYSGALLPGNFTITKQDVTSVIGTVEEETTSFNSNNLVSSTKNAQGKEIQTSYDGEDFTLISEDDGEKQKVQTFDSFQKLLKQETTSGSGQILTQTYDYDDLGRILNLGTNFLQFNASYSPTSNGLVQKISVSGNNNQESITITKTFDGYGNLLKDVQSQADEKLINVDEEIDSKGLSYSSGLKQLLKNGEQYKIEEGLVQSYDLLSRKTKTHNRVDGIDTEVKYYGLSSVHSENNVFQQEEIRSGLGLLTQVKTNLENHKINLDKEDKLRGLNNFIYSRDLKGRIIQVANKSTGTALFDRFYEPNYTSLNEGFVEANIDAYGRLKDISISGVVSQRFAYDDLSRLTSIKTRHVTENVKYDLDSNITEEKIIVGSNTIISRNSYDSLRNLSANTIQIGDNQVAVQIQSVLGKTKFVNPFISNIEYDSHGFLSEVKFKNIALKLKHDAAGSALNLSMGDLAESYSYDSRKLMIAKSNNKQNVRFSYDEDKKLINAKKIASSQRDEFGNLVHPDLTYLKASNGKMSGHLATISGKKVVYKNLNQILQVGSEVYVSSELHQIDGKFVKYMKLGSRIVGAFICGTDCAFYPILTDYQNSVKAIFKEDGTKLVQRTYSEWGDLLETEYSNDEGRAVDKLIRYDFAGLVRPFQSEFLISQSRVYAPAFGEWHKVDPLLYEKPEFFLSARMSEVDGLEYAGGDPVNFVDPTGKEAATLIYFGTAGLIGGALGVMGEMMSPTMGSYSSAFALGFGTGLVAASVAPAAALAVSSGAISSTVAVVSEVVLSIAINTSSSLFGQSYGGKPLDSQSWATAVLSGGLGGLMYGAGAAFGRLAGVSGVGKFDFGMGIATTNVLSPVETLGNVFLNLRDENQGDYGGKCENFEFLMPVLQMPTQTQQNNLQQQGPGY